MHCSSGKCSINCPKGCGCVSDPDTGKCQCFCAGEEAHLEVLEFLRSNRLNYSFHEFSPADLSKFLGSEFPDEFSFEGGSLDVLQDVELKEASLHEVLAAFGFAASSELSN